jgi:replication initiation and membrane attachment protein DnaB
LLSYTKIVNRYTYIKIIANRYTYVEIKTYLKCSSDEVYKHSKINKMKQGEEKKKERGGWRNLTPDQSQQETRRTDNS